MTRLQTAIESLNLSNGERQARAWNQRAVEPVSSSPQAVAKGNLYVLIELGGEQPASPRLYRLLLNTIQGVYYDAQGGITGGVTEAILAAHQILEQHNALYPDNQQLAGVSCVALRGEELHLGIGGPALVLVGHPGRVEQFPSEISPTTRPLGEAGRPGVELFRTSVNGEALVIQLHSEWAARVPTRKLAAVAVANDLEAALEYLEALAPATTLSALVVRITQPPAQKAPPEAAELLDQPQDEGVLALDDSLEALYKGETPEPLILPDGEEPPVEPPPDEALAPATQRATVAEGESVEEAAAEPARPRLWLLALLAPLLLVVVVVVALWWQQRSIQQRFDSLVQGAQAALQSATAAEAPEEVARDQLQSAQERVQEALVLRPANEQAIELQETVQAALDEVNRVTPLYKLVTLREVGGPDSELSRVVIQGSRVYLLDSGSDQVLRYGLDEISGLIPETSGGILAQRGQTLAAGQVVGELVDMTWAAAASLRPASALLVLDSNGNLLEVDSAGELNSLVVADRQAWQSPRLIASYNANFYLLDSGLGRILRYRPGEGGYDSPAENYFEEDASLDLSQAVDMAIDGNIWLLYLNGAVQKFFAGRQEPFELEPPPDGALLQPQAIYVGSEAGAAQNLFIADSGNGRILEYDKAGAYLRQYRPVDEADREKLRTMRALSVDEVERTFYILTTEALLQTDIP